MYIKHKSTIFKTKTDDFGRIKTGLNDGIKDAVTGIFNGNFFKRQNLLSDSDITAIKAYNAEIDKCTTSQTAFYRTMQNTSKEAQNVVAAANGNKVALDGLTKSSKAAELGMKALSMAGNMLLMWGISEAITIIYDLATASDRLQESAAQLGSEFANTKSDIDGYKSKIEELYQTINDDTSSYEDTYDARQELLKIQDEMIDKFGDEADAVKLVTDAINGQTDSLDTLTQDKWQETVNAFNSDRDKKWTEKVADAFANIGHGNNFQRMIDEMEDTEVTFHIMPMYGDETYEEFSKKLKEDFGASLTQYERDDAFTLSGDLDDIYKQLLNIQNLAKDMGIDDTFLKDLGDQADEAKGKLEDYQEIYSQHVLYDKIFNSDDYEKSFDEINKAYEKYQDAFASADEKAIEEAKQNYAEIVQGAIEGLDDQSVIDYFNNMYPDLQEVVGGWEFEVKFKAAVDDNKDDFENEVKDAVSQFNTAEDIKNYNPKVATEEQKDAYLQLKQYADDYGLTLDQLIDKLEQMGLLQSQSKSDLLNKLVPSKNGLTAGVSSALSDAMAGVDADEVTKWVDSLTEEEAKLANSKEFENALEEQKEKLNGAALSADDYEAALQSVKDAQEQSSDETPISASLPDIISKIDDLQTKFKDLDSIMADFVSGDDIDVSNLNNILTTFQSLADAGKDVDMSNVENAIKQISDASSLDEAQSSLDALCREYINASGILDNLTEDNKDLIATRLQGIGVANSEEVVESALAAQKLATKVETEGLTEATMNEIQQIMNEEGATDETRKCLAEFLITKMDLNNNPINTASDIQQLIALANAADVGAQYVARLQSVLANMGSATPAKYKNDYKDTNSMNQEKIILQQSKDYDTIEEWGQAEANRIAGILQKEINASKLNASDYIVSPVKYGGGSSTKSAQNKANKSSGSGNNGSDSSQEPQEKDYDWIETLISRIERNITNLGKTVSATYKSWSTRNNALAQELGAVNSEISTQQAAYNKYMQLANSVGLNEGYASLVRNGTLDVSTIADDTLNEQIEQYKSYYESALEAADAVQDLQDKLADLAKTKFDNVTSQFESQIKLIEQESGMYSTFIDEVETSGHLVSQKYYEMLISTEKKNIDTLKNEYNSLSTAMGEAIAAGKIEQGSEQWNDMYASILDVQTAIEDANKSLIEYQSNLRQLKWDTFDKTEDYISKIQDESNFLIDLMGNQTLYDKDTGKDTKYATAIKGLHAVNYNTYMAQSDDYAKEIQQIDKEMADDQSNTTLLERRQELLKLQQEAIKNAEQEKQSIKSLVSDGYDAMLDALQKIIDKYKDTLSVQKDLFDYQNNITEKTDNIASLQKQLSAFSGDTSEETQSKVQQLQQQLKDAQSDLQETEYDKYLSDQEALLDSVVDTVQEWINARLDDLDGLIQSEIDNVNNNSAQINQTIQDESQKVGYTITDQMKAIWNSSDGFTAVVSNYANGFQNTATATLNSINLIKGFVENLSKKADAEAAEKARQAELARQQAVQQAAQAAAAAKQQQQASAPSNSGGSSSSGGGGTWGSWFVYKKDSYPKNKLQTSTSVVDRLKYRDIDSSFSKRKDYYYAMGGTGNYTGSSSQNRWIISQMAAHGYAKGTKSATKGIHLVGEDASEIGIAQGRLVDFSGGETVFNGDMTKKLWEFADNPANFMSDLVPKLPTIKSASANSSFDVGGVNIVMNGVNDVESFGKELRSALANDTRTQKMLKTFIYKDGNEYLKWK